MTTCERRGPANPANKLFGLACLVPQYSRAIRPVACYSLQV